MGSSKQQTAAEAMEKTKNFVRGVNLERVDEDVLSRYVKKIGLKPKDGSVREMVVALSDHFADLEGTLTCAGDTGCGGVSSSDLPECPYCGAADGTAPSGEVAAEAPAEGGEEMRVAPGESIGAAKARRKAAPKKKASNKRKDQPTALAPVATTEVITVRELDKAVRDIRKLETEGAMAVWRIGRVMLDVHNRGVFATRRDEHGKQSYRHFSAWVMAETSFTSRYAYELMSLAEKYTEETVCELGPTKLRVIARVPDDVKRETLLNRARSELLTRSQLEREVKELGEGSGDAGLRRGEEGARDGRGSEGANRARRAGRDRVLQERMEEKGVTVTIRPGRLEIPMFARVPDGKPVTRAFDLADEPYALEDTLNGIKVRYVLKMTDEGIVLAIDRTRE